MSRTHSLSLLNRRPALAMLLALLVIPALACAGGPGTDLDVNAGSSPILTSPATGAVYVNGVALTVYEQAQLESLLGPLPPGRYWLDQYGNLGVEGGPALVNLAQLYSQLYGSQGGVGGGSAGGGWIDRGQFGATGGDGATCYYNDPETGASVIVPCTN